MQSARHVSTALVQTSTTIGNPTSSEKHSDQRHSEQATITAKIAAMKAATATDPVDKTKGGDQWCDLFKGASKRLTKKGAAFTLPSGEACVKIPKAVIERNQKSWESFILGHPSAQGLDHSIVNGI